LRDLEPGAAAPHVAHQKQSPIKKVMGANKKRGTGRPTEDTGPSVNRTKEQATDNKVVGGGGNKLFKRTITLERKRAVRAID